MKFSNPFEKRARIKRLCLLILLLTVITCGKLNSSIDESLGMSSFAIPQIGSGTERGQTSEDSFWEKYFGAPMVDLLPIEGSDCVKGFFLPKNPSTSFAMMQRRFAFRIRTTDMSAAIVIVCPYESGVKNDKNTYFDISLAAYSKNAQTKEWSEISQYSMTIGGTGTFYGDIVSHDGAMTPSSSQPISGDFGLTQNTNSKENYSTLDLFSGEISALYALNKELRGLTDFPGSGATDSLKSPAQMRQVQESLLANGDASELLDALKAMQNGSSDDTFAYDGNCYLQDDNSPTNIGPAYTDPPGSGSDSPNCFAGSGDSCPFNSEEGGGQPGNEPSNNAPPSDEPTQPIFGETDYCCILNGKVVGMTTSDNPCPAPSTRWLKARECLEALPGTPVTTIPQPAPGDILLLPGSN